jgi:NAD(P)H-flavin reductase
MNAPVDPMVPEPRRVLDARKESDDVVTLTIGSGPSGSRPFRAGQFNMLYAFGVGEVAISMSGSPASTGTAVHTIKAVGAVTEALCRLNEGSAVGVRGPFGAPWPMDHVVGSDLLLVAGGIGLAPLRPVVYQVLQQRSTFGRLFLLVGARTPDDLLFRAELDEWQARDDITVLVTVDRADASWKGRVGVVPALLSELELRPATTAFVCGPEVMMRFTVRELSRRGQPDDRIHLSMERNMKCAVGFCGHCQYGPNFVCKDGPVLRYDRIRRLFWLREI